MKKKVIINKMADGIVSNEVKLNTELEGIVYIYYCFFFSSILTGLFVNINRGMVFKYMWNTFIPMLVLH